MKSYIEAFAKCEIEWITQFGESVNAQKHIGARHTPQSHLHSLGKWLALIPAIIPSKTDLCEPVLSHPDLSGANILVSDDHMNPAVSGIIDWQGASVGPVFNWFPPRFLNADPDDIRKLGVDGIAPDPYPDTANTAVAAVSSDNAREILVKRYLNSLFEHSPMLYEVLSSSHLENLRAGIYYSSHSWSDGLALFDAAQMAICDAYGTDVPRHPGHIECPASFTEQERKKLAVDMKFHRQEGVLEHLCRNYLEKRGMGWQEDGGIPTYQFDDAQRALAELHTRATKPLLAEPHRMNAFHLAWPYRKGKVSLTSETCS